MSQFWIRFSTATALVVCVADARGEPPAAKEEAPCRASSELAHRSAGFYGCARATDRNHSSAWCEGKADNGIGEWITLAVAGDAVELVVMPGYGNSDRGFAANNRIARARIEVLDGAKNPNAEIAFDDARALRSFPLPAFARKGQAVQVRLTILAIHPGKKHHDTCISEWAALAASGPYDKAACVQCPAPDDGDCVVLTGTAEPNTLGCGWVAGTGRTATVTVTNEEDEDWMETVLQFWGPDGVQRVELTYDPSEEVVPEPEFLAGGQIAYLEGGTGGPENDIAIVNISTGMSTQLTATLIGGDAAVWNDDESALAFVEFGSSSITCFDVSSWKGNTLSVPAGVRLKSIAWSESRLVATGRKKKRAWRKSYRCPIR